MTDSKDSKDEKKGLNEELEEVPGYKAPAASTMQEMLSKDKDDESLEKYKARLLGKGGDKKVVPKYPSDPRKIVVDEVRILVPDRDPIILDVKDKKLKDKPYTLKEGTPFTVVLRFWSQHDIASGLQYLNLVYRMGIQVDKVQQMLGRYGPSAEINEYRFPEDQAPAGFGKRGHYTAKGKLIDDDKTVYCEFEYSFDIAKDWK